MSSAATLVCKLRALITNHQYAMPDANTVASFTTLRVLFIGLWPFGVRYGTQALAKLISTDM